MDGVSVDKKHLRFMVPYDGMVTSDSVHVMNNSQVPITFKMKTTTDKNGFVVQPKTGIIVPGGKAEITMTYKCDIETNPRLRLDVVPFETASNAHAMSSADFWKRREAVFKTKNNARADSETTEELTLASLPLYKYNFHVELVTFDERKKGELDSILAGGGVPQRSGLIFKPSKRSTDSILVENHSNAPVTFRVRSTDDGLFRAEPSSGEVGANASVEVMCHYNGLHIERKRHFFQVDVANLEHENPPMFWRLVDEGKTRVEILKHKFKVQFEAARQHSEDSIASSSCIGAHGLSFRSHHHHHHHHHRSKKARHDSTSEYKFSSASPSWFGTAFESNNIRNRTQSQSHHMGHENFDDAAPCSLPNVNLTDTAIANNYSNNYSNRHGKKRTSSPRTLSRTISDVWDNLRRQPSFLLSRNSRRMQNV